MFTIYIVLLLCSQSSFLGEKKSRQVNVRWVGIAKSLRGSNYDIHSVNQLNYKLTIY